MMSGDVGNWCNVCKEKLFTKGIIIDDSREEKQKSKHDMIKLYSWVLKTFFLHKATLIRRPYIKFAMLNIKFQ